MRKDEVSPNTLPKFSRQGVIEATGVDRSLRAEVAFDGNTGGCCRPRLASRGLWRAATVSSRVFGIVKGCACDGTGLGRGGSLDGVGRTRRGASRRGSTCLR